MGQELGLEVGRRSRMEAMDYILVEMLAKIDLGATVASRWDHYE